MRSIVPQLGLVFMLYLPGADTITYLAEKELDNRLMCAAINVRDSYMSGNHQAAANYGKKAIALKELRESISKFASEWFPLHILQEKQKERRNMLKN